jgi:hypothetical protein
MHEIMQGHVEGRESAWPEWSSEGGGQMGRASKDGLWSKFGGRQAARCLRDLVICVERSIGAPNPILSSKEPLTGPNG